MAQDLYIDPLTNDLAIATSTGSLYMCETIEQLTRQRVEITLRTYLGEWFLNTDFGLPYFESIFGKNKRGSADLAIRSTVLDVEGVTQILSYTSTLDKINRSLTVSMTIKTASGDILPLEVSV